MRSGSEDAGPARPLPREIESDRREFDSRLRASGFAALQSPRVGDLLVRFAALVYEQSENLSLVSRSDRTVILTRHVLDSLNPISLFDSAPSSVLDIGSGAGFPGIPLAIVWPESRFVLLESRERKAGFLERAVRELGLPGVTVVCARLEEYGKTWKADPVACLTIRAVGNLPQLLQSAAAAAAPSARWIYFLGSDRAAPEIAASIRRVDQEASAVRGAFGGMLLTGRLAGRVSGP